MKRFFLPALFLLLSSALSAQVFSVSTNLLDWANFGTVNAQAGVSFSQHLSLHAGARYNNWNFGSAEKGTAMQNRSRTACLALRYWPWNVYSSWWFSARTQVEEYNRGGLLKRPLTEEGLAAGVGLGVGYSRMLNRHWNLDLGVGGWFGKTRYTQYRCPRCGRVISRDDGTPVRDATRWFVQPSNDLQISLVYVF